MKNQDEVYILYNKIYKWFDQARTKTLMEKEYLDYINQRIPKSSEILDLGCGTGEPIAEFFIKCGHIVTGVDAADNMLTVCKNRFPEHNWVLEDMRKCDLKKQFDVIIAWDSFFHLPHQHQRNMFSVFANHAKNNTYLLFTSGPEHGEVISQMNGYDFYHASLAQDEYRCLLQENGFEVVIYKQVDQNCGDHTVWLAKHNV